MLVNSLSPGVAQDHPRITVKRLYAPLQVRRSAQIIVGGPLEVFAGREIKETAEIPGSPQIHVVAIVADSTILCRIGAAYLLGSIGRRVVRDDQLKIRKNLRQQRVQSLSQVVLAIVYWQADANTRRSLNHSLSKKLRLELVDSGVAGHANLHSREREVAPSAQATPVRPVWHPPRSNRCHRCRCR